MSTEDQKSPHQELQEEQLNELSEFVKNSLQIAHEEIAEKVISRMISSGLKASAVAEGLAIVCDKRGHIRPIISLEQASLLLQEDEP